MCHTLHCARLPFKRERVIPRAASRMVLLETKRFPAQCNTDIAMWMKALAPFVEETCAQIGKVPSAAIEFGAADPDAEIERIKAHLNSIGVNLPLQF